jgi:hypothetical protein
MTQHRLAAGSIPNTEPDSLTVAALELFLSRARKEAGSVNRFSRRKQSIQAQVI